MVKVNKGNGDASRLDLDHELPQAEQDGPEVASEASPCAGLEAEIEHLKAEKAGFLDRLARLQAEFDNYRKRSAREQQDFRDYEELSI